jgi:hypothetical protein
MIDLVPCSSSSSRRSALSYALSPSMRLGRTTRRIRRFASGQSCASTPLNRMAISRPLASASAWIFVLRPPRERPTACFFSALFRRPPIGGLSRAWSRSSGYRWLAHSRPTAPCPANKPVIDCRRRTVLGRTIAPAATALQHMDNAADDTPVVYSLDASHVRRQMRLDPPPLLIARPKKIPAHAPRPPNESSPYGIRTALPPQQN